MPKFFDTGRGNAAGKMKLLVTASANAVDLFLMGVIGEPEDAADAKSLATVLAKHPGKPVTVRINSPGGSFYDGLAIANALRRHDAKTTAVVDGLCASAATVVATGCDEILMNAVSSWHVHEAIIGSVGHQADLKEALTWLEACDKHLADVYSARTGRSTTEIRRVMLGPAGDGTHFNAREALAFGWIDSIIPVGNGKSGRTRKTAAATAGKAAANVENLRLRLRVAKARAAIQDFELAASAG